MRAGKLNCLEPLLAALRSGKLIVFAGAGVSLGAPANLPSFRQLTRLIAAGTGERQLDGEPDDRFLGRLHQRRIDVHGLAAKQLSRPGLTPTTLHYELLRLFPTLESVRVVTTNFDLLIEVAAGTVFGSSPEVYSGAALPLGRDFTGIVHVHGALRAETTLSRRSEFVGPLLSTDSLGIAKPHSTTDEGALN